MSDNSIFQLLRADGSITINKALIHAIGLTEAIIYSELLSRYFYFEDKHMLCQNDTFFNSVNDLLLGTGIYDKSQRTAIKNLEKKGLLTCVIAGLPKKRYFKLNFNSDLINSILIEGKQNIIKLKAELEEKNKKNLEKLDKLELLSILPQGTIETEKGLIKNTNYNNTTILNDEKNEIKTYRYKNPKRKLTKNNKSEYKDFALEAAASLADNQIKNNVI